MAVATIYNLYGVDKDGDILGGITRQNVVTGSDVRGEALSGDFYSQFKALYGQAARGGFGSKAITSALAFCGVTGLDIGGITAGLVFYAQKRATGGTRTSGSNHRKYVMKAGILVPRTLTVDTEGDAEISYEAMAIYDGSNAPLVESDTVALPSLPVDAERFALGPVTLGGVTLPGVRSVSIDFGIEVQMERADGDLYDTFSSISTINPTVTFGGVNIEWLKSSNIPMLGQPATQANTSFYLRKRAVDATFVSDVTEEHAKFTAAGLVTIETAFDGAAGARGEVEMTLSTRWDGTNAPLKYAAAAIT